MRDATDLLGAFSLFNCTYSKLNVSKRPFMYEEVISYFMFQLIPLYKLNFSLAPRSSSPTYHFLVNKQICRVCPKPWPPSQNYCCLTNQVDALCTTLDCRLNMMWPSRCAAWWNRRSRLFCVLMIIIFVLRRREESLFASQSWLYCAGHLFYAFTLELSLNWFECRCIWMLCIFIWWRFFNLSYEHNLTLFLFPTTSMIIRFLAD